MQRLLECASRIEEKSRGKEAYMLEQLVRRRSSKGPPFAITKGSGYGEKACGEWSPEAEPDELSSWTTRSECIGTMPEAKRSAHQRG